MNTFKERLRKKLADNLYRKLGSSNHDEDRFGKYHPKQESFIEKAKNGIKRFIRYKKHLVADSYLTRIFPYESRLQRIFDHLSEKDRLLLLDIVAFRILGPERIRLPRHNTEYKEAIVTARNLQTNDEVIDPHFKHFLLNKFDLNPIGFNLAFFHTAASIAIDFIIEQYAYKKNGNCIIEATEGDIVIDAGGCWGDTALYFADKVGPEGKVFSFEFIPNNISLFNLNVNLNPLHEKRITLITQPISNQSNQKIYYKDEGPASRIELSPFDNQTGITTTLSIDDFVSKYNIERIDFIKMDIEGAEQNALLGAIESIKKFKPKLAIAIYHSMDDFSSIPNWILDLNLGYSLYLDHFTIHEEETVIFAQVENK
jgi:FkbM family methyltransferase